MKKTILTLACMALAASAALAEGYQVNTFSAKQEGMGHVGVAMPLGAESQIFNPGAVAFMGKTMEISGAMSAISSKVDCTYEGKVYKTDNKVSTPLNFSAAFRIYDNLYAGVTFYTPYGSSINWGRNWPGAVLNQSVDLKVFTVQPTFSWKITPKLSVGAGLMIAWGNVNLNKGLVAASSLDRVIALQNMANAANPNYQQLPMFGEVSPAYANLKGSAKPTLGVNLGAYYQINDQWAVGASWRSKMNMSVSAGDVYVGYANEVAQYLLEEKLKNLNYTNFKASMPCPYVFTLGVSYKPITPLVLEFDLQLNGWGSYKYLDIEFAEQAQFNQHLKKDYHNARTYHFGAQYSVTNRFDVRLGLMLDNSPCNEKYYNPETPGAFKVEPSVGLSFRPIQGLSIDLAFMYVHAMKVKNAVGQYDDFLAPIYNATISQFGPAAAQMGLTPLPETGTFKADYKVRAIIPAIGISYSF